MLCTIGSTSMKTRSFTLLVVLTLGASTVGARQEESPRPPRHQALNLTVNDYGISFGNSRRTNGLRINLTDNGLERVNGLNLTLWRPHDNPGAVVNGLALDLVCHSNISETDSSFFSVEACCSSISLL